ncbi:hypothetical protein [Actinomadura violacea]|uniref:C2H2-type domain-containing protein n=1 Tax=Actinomadura violacea TaxID=2819934 RepID=A0ABS3S637_9ACTN|nr:hypothetical protein [Actinomadura violacea]MBO2464476.1 hypothetical protein [Actinomadura violacea]
MTSTTTAPAAASETIDGLAVVADEAALSPLSKPGKPIIFHRIRELLLEDGTVRYRCIECAETSRQLGKIRYHLRTHLRPDTARPSRKTKPRTGRAATDQVGATRTRHTSATAAASAVTAPQAAPASAPSAAHTPETGGSTTASRATVLPDLTLAELANRLYELAELDKVRTENDELRRECAELRAGHDELLAATRGLADLRRRAETAEQRLATIQQLLREADGTGA